MNFEQYHLFFIIFLALSILLFFIVIIMFFYFRIFYILKRITGMERRKMIKRMKAGRTTEDEFTKMEREYFSDDCTQYISTEK